MVKTVRAKWSEITGNRKEIDETIIGKGIEEQSLVNSDELNSIVYRQDEMLDDLQRANAWNIGKEYNQGDMIFVNVNYKRLSDAIGKGYKCFVICKQDKVTAEPFINKDRKAIAFSKNYDYAVTQFIIQVDNDSTALTHFINSDFWEFVNINDDLSNATKLSVSNEAKLGSQGKDSSIITFDRDIILNGNLDTKGTFDIKGNLTAGSLNSNNNIAWGNASAKTPSFTANGDEIVNAEWFRNADEVVFIDNMVLVYRTLQTNKKPTNFIQPPYITGINFSVNNSVVNLKQQPKADGYFFSYGKLLLQFYKIFPVDFNIERFNSMFFVGKSYCIREDLANDCRIKGLNIQGIFKYEYAINMIDNSAIVIFPKDYGQLRRFLTIPHKIKVDFSKSFEINTYEYFKSIGINNIIFDLHRYDYTNFFLDENNFDIISWDRDKRILAFTFIEPFKLNLGCDYMIVLGLSSL